MSDGAVLLRDYPFPKINMACDRCPRSARYDKTAMIERVGEDARLPSLRLEIAAAWGCPIAQKQLSEEHLPGFERCGAIYPDLARRS